MSTPSGKPAGPLDLSEYVSQRARERLQTGRQSSDHDPAGAHDEAFRSPYAPKRADERSNEPPPIAVGRSPRPAPEEHDRRERPAFGEIPVPEQPLDLDAAALRRSASASAAHHPEQAPAPADRDEPAYSDDDIERLEASLRWLQREETATRLLRGTRRPAAPPPADFDDDEPGPLPRHRLPSPRSLEPEHLVPPPDLNRGWGHWPFSILLASAVGAGVAYYFAAGDSTPPPAPRSQVASSEAKPSAPPPPVTLHRPELFPTVARDDEAGAVTQAELSSSQRAKAARLAKLPDKLPEEAAPPPTPPAPAPAAAAPAAPPPTATAVRTLDPDEIKLLVQQGDQFVATGDLVTARVVFKRAADAGDAGAAMALAATYDPLMLARLGVVGVTADVEKARSWYQKAASLGSSEATRRLSLLANQ